MVQGGGFIKEGERFKSLDLNSSELMMQLAVTPIQTL